MKRCGFSSSVLPNLLFALAVGSSYSPAQGTITVANGSYAFARTNAMGMGGTVGNTAPVFGAFYYAVFTASSTVTSIDPNLQDLLTPTWTFTGVYATNSAVATGGRFLNGSSGSATSQGWTPGVTNSYLLLGWSAAVAGMDVASVECELRGAVLDHGCWVGGGFATNLMISAYTGYIGVSTIGFGEAGGGTAGGGTGLPPLLLFGTTPTAAGTPIGSPFDLYLVSGSCTPEPTGLALLGLGAVALLLLCFRKSEINAEGRRILILFLAIAVPLGVAGQGTITVADGTYSFARTNALGMGGTKGNTSTALGAFYYGVFIAPSTVTSIDANLQDLLGPVWTFAGVYATNTAVVTGGRLNGGAGAQAAGWVPGVARSYLLLGWSAAVAGMDVASVENELRGAVLDGGCWFGGGFATNANLGPLTGYIGVTCIGFGEAEVQPASTPCPCSDCLCQPTKLKSPPLSTSTSSLAHVPRSLHHSPCSVWAAWRSCYFVRGPGNLLSPVSSLLSPASLRLTPFA